MTALEIREWLVERAEGYKTAREIEEKVTTGMDEPWAPRPTDVMEVATNADEDDMLMVSFRDGTKAHIRVFIHEQA